MEKEEIVNQPTREEVKQEMLNYLQQKYGEEFESQYIEYKSWAQKGHEVMLAFPKKGSEEDVFVVNRYQNGKKYEDGYIGLLMKPTYEGLIEESLASSFKESKIVLNYKYVYPEAFDKETDFETFKQYANRKNNFVVSIYVLVDRSFSSEQLEKSFEKIKEELKKEISICSLTISCYLEEDYRKDVLDYALEHPEKSSFPTSNRLFSKYDSWGKIDFDYEYEEGD